MHKMEHLKPTETTWTEGATPTTPYDARARPGVSSLRPATGLPWRGTGGRAVHRFPDGAEVSTRGAGPAGRRPRTATGLPVEVG